MTNPNKVVVDASPTAEKCKIRHRYVNLSIVGLFAGIVAVLSIVVFIADESRSARNECFDMSDRVKDAEAEYRSDVAVTNAQSTAIADRLMDIKEDIHEFKVDVKEDMAEQTGRINDIGQRIDRVLENKPGGM